MTRTVANLGRGPGGYLLMETIVAMAVLSLSMAVMHAGIRQAVLARGQARDFTTARFVLEEVVAGLEMRLQLVEGKGEGAYQPDPRFTYAWEVSKISVPRPPLPDDLPEVSRQQMEKFFTGYMPKIRVAVRWQRAGFDFEAVGETLLGPEKLWVPRGAE